MTYTEEMTISEILLRLASIRSELLQVVNDIEKISKNICYKAEQTESQQVTSKLADTVIPTDTERGAWDYKGNGKWEQTEPSNGGESDVHKSTV